MKILIELSAVVLTDVEKFDQKAHVNFNGKIVLLSETDINDDLLTMIEQDIRKMFRNKLHEIARQFGGDANEVLN